MTQDFIIIGGGIAGVSLAAELAALGSVTLYEAEPALGYHASGRSAALFERTYGKAAVVALTLASEDHHRNANGGVLSPRGLLAVARADQQADWQADCAAMQLEPISPAEARGIVPILNPATLAHAAWHEGAWDIDTDRLLQDYARAARARGGRIETGRAVRGIARDAATGIWRLDLSDGSQAEARMLVNAAGAWVNEVAAMAGVRSPGFTPLRRSMARIPAPGGLDVAGWPMLFGPGESWYAKPDAGALIVSPAEEHPMPPQDAWADDMVLAEGLARYEEMVTEPVTRMIGNWAGLRTFAPDRVLVIGPDPVVPGFFWQAGQGGYGFQTAPAAARLGADLVAGRAPVLDAATVAALSPARFA